MTRQWNRRELLAQLAAASAEMLLPQGSRIASRGLRVAGQDCEVQLTSVSADTLRLSVLPLQRDDASRIPFDGSLVKTTWGAPLATFSSDLKAEKIKCGNLEVLLSPGPLSFTIATSEGPTIQQLSIDDETGVVSFFTGDSPLLGLGEGGPQFDRRGATDRMKSGQGGYQLRTHGGRVPINWLISAGPHGW